MDSNRLEQFTVTKRLYDEMPQTKEFLIATREYDKVSEYLGKYGLMKDVTLLPYEVKKGFNPSRAFNMGVRASKYANIIITSPEIKPTTDVLAQFSGLHGKNVLAEVWDEDIDGNLSILVCSTFRAESPAYYFLAMYQKDDIYKINGWDEDFMLGYAYEDNDFGERWKRAGLPWEMHDEIKAVHQYHPRGETIPNGTQINFDHFNANNDNGVTYCKNGLISDTI